MQSQENYFGNLEDKDILQDLFKEDYYTAKETLDRIDHRIAERKKLEYKNIYEMERQRRKMEETVNHVQCFGYSPKTTMIKSKLETEMVNIAIKKGEEAVQSFKDVDRLEADRRKILEDLRGEKSMSSWFGGST